MGTSATSAADLFSYETAPTITAVTPPAGLTAGGTPVTITGTGFTDATAVAFGPSAATRYTVISGTEMTAVSPASPAGMVDIAVTNLAGTSSPAAGDEFTFEGTPAVTSLSPTAGLPAGGTPVTITGTDFNDLTAVDFGTQAATITASSPTSLTVTDPAGAAGTVDVTVVTPSGTSATSVADQFTYEAPPSVTSLSPVSGPIAGGAPVTITGTDFTATSAVDFGTAAGTITASSPTSLTVTAPAGAAGTVDVTVVTPSGTSAIAPPADQYTYESTPTVTGVTPVAGPLGGATAVTITGTNFTGATAVAFGANSTTTYSVVSPTSITVTAPAGAAGAVDVTVTTGTGTSAVNQPADQYTYETGPTVSTVSPVAGLPAGGLLVSVTGTNFTGATGVSFGPTVTTDFTVVSPILITVTSPSVSSDATVDVTVVTPTGTSATAEPADQFTYEDVPTVSAVSPVAGLLAGGATVTVTGTDFTDATQVMFGPTAGTAVSVNPAGTSITVTSPPATAGTVDVTVVTPSGTSAIAEPADQFTYEAVPSVSSVSPVAGPPATGTPVSITGANFTGATGVSFGPTATTDFTVVSPSLITVTSPVVSSAGTVDVTVTTPAGTSALSAADQFAYEAAPAVGAISPMAGLAAGGSTVTITGTGFSAASSVLFGTTPATSYSVTSSTQVTAIAPAGTAGTVDVTVTTPVGTSALNQPADEFTYEAVPTVGSVAPVAGPTAGGTSVTLTGSNFTDATSVQFGGTPATGVSVTSPTSMTATSPASAGGAAGTVDITVTTPIGTSATSAAAQFSYAATPSVASVSPAAGVTAGGTSVTITGTNFTAVTGVSFGATPATSYTVLNGTTVTATSPASPGGAAGPVDVTVTTPLGTSAIVPPADQFTYEDVATVTAVSPNAGALNGGTSVTITGTNFSAALGVSFGSVPAPSGFVVVSSSEITATSPAEPAGPVDITVTTPIGTSATSAADRFSYEALPAVSAITPVSGPLAGGTSVTITGTGFSAATGASFGPAAAASFTVTSATSVTAVSAPAGAGTVDVTVTTPVGESASTSRRTSSPTRPPPWSACSAPCPAPWPAAPRSPSPAPGSPGPAPSTSARCRPPRSRSPRPPRSRPPRRPARRAPST